MVSFGIDPVFCTNASIILAVPLVVVFTKLDLLVNTLEGEAMTDGEMLDRLALEERKLESLERLCLQPVRAAAGSDCLLHVAVSCASEQHFRSFSSYDMILMTAEEGYEDTLAALVDMTTENIRKYVKDEAAHYIATIAQRVNISLKVALTITYVSFIVCLSQPLSTSAVSASEKRVSFGQTEVPVAEDGCRILEGACDKPKFSESIH